ncbi:hypothetical protein CDAR_431441 [Caerostris darwini]|uniref:Uncharacterized protein n=1 Tax=Caerostris darwini TaxID=1538125 RepID=A0AAV4W767_9ARAC|nr:hypothetical protein CDAR_431441 [Caerostris darwini]
MNSKEKNRTDQNLLLNPTANPSGFGLRMTDGFYDRKNIGKSHVRRFHLLLEVNGTGFFSFSSSSCEGRINFPGRADLSISDLMMFSCHIS